MTELEVTYNTPEKTWLHILGENLFRRLMLSNLGIQVSTYFSIESVSSLIIKKPNSPLDELLTRESWRFKSMRRRTLESFRSMVLMLFPQQTPAKKRPLRPQLTSTDRAPRFPRAAGQLGGKSADTRSRRYVWWRERWCTGGFAITINHPFIPILIILHDNSLYNESK